jgi:hypothetical protein
MASSVLRWKQLAFRIPEVHWYTTRSVLTGIRSDVSRHSQAQRNCIFQRYIACRDQFLRKALYYTKPKKKGPSGQAWMVVLGSSAAIFGASIFFFGELLARPTHVAAKL